MKKSRVIFLFILGGLIAIYSTVNFRTQSTYENLNKEIDSLQTSIKENHEKIEQYDKTIEVIKDSIVKLDNRVEENNKQIEKIEKEYDEKLDSIGSLYSSELQLYVSKRYKDK